MRARALCTGLITGALVLLGAPAAMAATAVLAGSTLTVTGDATAETITVSQSGANIVVTAPSFATDPDGGGANCANPTATTVACADVAVSAVVVNAGGGGDILSDTRSTSDNAANLNGEGGDDALTASTGSDFFGGGNLSGGDGNDVLNAGAGRLEFSDSGGPGNDIFNGSAQFSDSFPAEAGSDLYNGGTRVPAPNEIVDDAATYQREAAADSIGYFARADALTISLDGVANDGSVGEADNVSVDVEVVSGGTGADTIVGNSLAVRLFGSDGGDVLLGGASDDDLNGGDGSDAIAGGGGDDFLDDGEFTSSDSTVVLPAAGNDTLDGGPGNDTLSSDRGSDNLIGGTGQDSAFFSRVIAQAPAVTTPVQSAGFTISLDDVANDGPTGAGEADNVHADIEDISTFGRAADAISGSAAPNTIFTDRGNDLIDAGAGADIINAGDGDDVISAVDQTTDRIDCGKGTDGATVDLAGGQPQRADVTLDCEAITGQAFGLVAPLIDTSKPVLRLRSRTVKVRTFLRNRTLPVQVSCSKPCALSGEAFTSKAIIRLTSRVGQLKIGAGRLARGGTATRTLRVKVTAKYMRSIRRKLRTRAQKRKGLSFIVTVTASDAIGIQAQASRAVRVRG